MANQMKIVRNGIVELIPNQEMDSRCPRQLAKHSEIGICKTALKRIQAIRHFIQEHDRLPTEDEESAMGGCPYAINNHKSLYCSFVEFSKLDAPKDIDKTLKSDIGAKIMIDPATVTSLHDKAIKKLKPMVAIDMLPDDNQPIDQTIYTGGHIIDAFDPLFNDGNGLEESDDS